MYFSDFTEILISRGPIPEHPIYQGKPANISSPLLYWNDPLRTAQNHCRTMSLIPTLQWVQWDNQDGCITPIHEHLCHRCSAKVKAGFLGQGVGSFLHQTYLPAINPFLSSFLFNHFLLQPINYLLTLFLQTSTSIFIFTKAQRNTKTVLFFIVTDEGQGSFLSINNEKSSNGERKVDGGA